MEKVKVDALNSVRLVNQSDLVQVSSEYGDLKQYLDQRGGRYYEILMEVKTQFFVSNLLKAFIPLSEIVKVRQSDGKYKFYSYEFPESDLDERKHSKIETEVDIFILSYLFNTDDRSYKDSGTNLPHNIKFVRGHSIHYDFECGILNFGEYLHWNRNIFASFFKENKIKNLKAMKTFFETLHDKIEAMRSFFGDENGSQFIREVFKQCGVRDMSLIFRRRGITAYSVDDFLQDFKGRLEKLYELVEKEIELI